MRYIIVWLLLVVAVHATSDEKTIALKAVGLASQLLSKNIKNDEGLAFYNLAKALKPDRDGVLLLTGYLSRNTPPKVIAGGADKNTLLTEIEERGMYILKKRFRKNADSGALALLYLRFVEKFKPKNSDALYALAYLNTYGFSSKLDDLYSKSFDLESVTKSGTKPSKAVDLELKKADQKIATDAINLGAILLAKNPGDSAGLNWARLGHHLDPTDCRGLFTLMQLQRGMKVKSSQSKVSANALLDDVIERAEYYQKKAADDNVSAHLAQLYFRIADAVSPTHRKVLIGLMRLEKDKLSATKDDLLDTDLASVMGKDVVKKASDNARKDAKAQSDKAAGTSGGPVYDGTKIRPRGRVTRKKVSRDYYYSSLEERVLGGKVENYTGQDVSGLIVESYIIASDSDKKRFFIARKSVFTDVLIRTRTWYDIPKLHGRFYKKANWRYYAWLLVVKSKDGKVLNYESTNSAIKKIALKIMEFPAARTSSSSSSSGAHYYRYIAFDKDGNKQGSSM